MDSLCASHNDHKVAPQMIIPFLKALPPNAKRPFLDKVKSGGKSTLGNTPTLENKAPDELTKVACLALVTCMSLYTANEKKRGYLEERGKFSSHRKIVAPSPIIQWQGIHRVSLVSYLPTIKCLHRLSLSIPYLPPPFGKKDLNLSIGDLARFSSEGINTKRGKRIKDRVTWEKLESGALKFNTDGAFTSNLREFGINGILKYENRVTLTFFSKSISHSDSNMVELLALKETLNPTNVPWRMRSHIIQLSKLLAKVQCWQIKHIPRTASCGGVLRNFAGLVVGIFFGLISCQNFLLHTIISAKEVMHGAKLDPVE
ncbi:Uncharacterized protein TCM_027045 [Theobroma cacao]|uniref:RNase H type-1 domain-containing protein n=1 Tax=Theobroma cacao TaxID=3641 RepID=A0A061G971_THECC|nr:Uncharacterized protein TCM_027045 [Theobroma cacao]